MSLQRFIAESASIPFSPYTSYSSRKRGAREKRARLVIKIRIPQRNKLSQKAKDVLEKDFGIRMQERPPFKYFYAYITGFRNIMFFTLKYSSLMEVHQYTRLIMLLSRYAPSKISYEFNFTFQKNLFEEAEKIYGSGKVLAREIGVKNYMISKYKSGRRIPFSVLMELIALLTFIKHKKIGIVRNPTGVPAYPSYGEILKNIGHIGIRHGTHSGGPHMSHQKELNINAEDLAHWVFGETKLEDFAEKLEFFPLGDFGDGHWKVTNSEFQFKNLQSIEPFVRLILLIDPSLFEGEIAVREYRRIFSTPKPLEGCLKELRVQSYRNISKNTFNFKPGLNLIIGSGGSGKTTIVEAIHTASYCHIEDSQPSGYDFAIEKLRGLPTAGVRPSPKSPWFASVIEHNETRFWELLYQYIFSRAGYYTGNELGKLNGIPEDDESSLLENPSERKELEILFENMRYDLSKLIRNNSILSSLHDILRQENSLENMTKKIEEIFPELDEGDSPPSIETDPMGTRIFRSSSKRRYPYSMFFCPILFLEPRTLDSRFHSNKVNEILRLAFEIRSIGRLLTNVLNILNGFRPSSAHVKILILVLAKYLNDELHFSDEHPNKELWRIVLSRDLWRELRIETFHLSEKLSDDIGKKEIESVLLFCSHCVHRIVRHYLTLLSFPFSPSFSMEYMKFSNWTWNLNDSGKRLFAICSRLAQGDLLTPKKLLLIDEIDTGLDDLTKTRLLFLLKCLNYNQLIMTTKNESAAIFAENVIKLNGMGLRN